MLMIIKILLFLLGMSLMVQVIAAFYSILDLWYTLKSAWPLVFKRIVIWAGLTIVIALVLEGEIRQAFLSGLVVYTGIFIAIPLFSKLASANGNCCASQMTSNQGAGRISTLSMSPANRLRFPIPPPISSVAPGRHCLRINR